MLESIVTSLFKLVNKIKNKNDIIDVCNIMANARSIIVFMPEKLDDFGIARNYLNVIHQNFPTAKIVIVLKQPYENLLNDAVHDGIIFVASPNINIFGLPKKELTQKIMSNNYDIAIDLNNSFHLVSTYLCQKCGAPLRICLEDSNREPFYNISFRFSGEKNLDIKYRNLFKYLSANICEPVANF